MDSMVSAPLFSGFLCLGMLLFIEIGRRVGERWVRQGQDAAQPGLAAVEGAVFALFGLLLAFTFNGAAARFDSRRMLIAEEANSIGTAYLRLDLLTADDQPIVRETFRRYVDSRLAFYRKLPDLEAAKAELVVSTNLQGQIWSKSMLAIHAKGASPDATKLLIPALNQMIDLTTTRTMASRIHPPRVIYGLLFVLSLGCALLAGFGMAGGRRSWTHILGYVAITVVTIFVIVDMEYPRGGLIRLDAYDQPLAEMRQSMR